MNPNLQTCILAPNNTHNPYVGFYCREIRGFVEEIRPLGSTTEREGDLLNRSVRSVEVKRERERERVSRKKS